MSFPTIVYRKPGIHPCRGGTYDYRGVTSQNELEAAQVDGWSLDHPDGTPVTEVVPEVIAEDAPPSREELEQKAKELGIKVKKGMTDAELLELINIELEG